MTQDEASLSVVALNGSTPGACGLTLLLVRRASAPEYAWLLDPEFGPDDPIDDDTLQSLADEGRVRLLEDASTVPPVSNTDQLFYAGADFLTLYEEVCGTAFPWEPLIPYAIKSSETRVAIGDHSVLTALRRRAAKVFLQQMDRKIPQEFHPEKSTSLEIFLQKIEEWGRAGALCVGSSSGDGLYWAFHQRIAAALCCMPGASERLRWIFDNQVQPHYPDVLYERYASEARVVAANWSIQSDMVHQWEAIRAESHHRKAQSFIATLFAQTEQPEKSDSDYIEPGSYYKYTSAAEVLSHGDAA